MIYTGIADEAGLPLSVQAKALRELGWSHLELRNVSVAGRPAANVHDLTDDEFAQFAVEIRGSGITVHTFASSIANWNTFISEPFDRTLDEVARAIPRMRALGTRYARIMSFAVKPDEPLQEAERFRRLREIVARFTDAGLVALHENCRNYGGLGASCTLRLLEEVPGLRLIFDPGNTIGTDDHDSPAGARTKQSAWAFYEKVRDFVDYLHVKDAVWTEVDGHMKRVHTWPGQGSAHVRRILDDVLARGQVHAVSIEPHVSGDLDQTGLSGPDLAYHNFVAYGRRLNALVAASPGSL